MRYTKYFIPTYKEDPSEAEVISHKLMLRAGMIRKITTGVYTYLPLGLKCIRKVENIVRDEMNRSGAIELLMPAFQPAELWKESGSGIITEKNFSGSKTDMAEMLALVQHMRK